MAKSKRQKTHHPTTNSTSALSHEEIWDDSALVRSWSDALAEYEYYHSIHARGEDVDEVLRQAELDDGANGPRDGAEGHMEMEMEQESADDGEIDDDVDVTTRQGGGESVPDADAGRDAVRMIGPSLPLSEAAHAETDVTAPDSALAPGPASAPAQPSVSASTPAPTTATATATATSADQTLENIKMAYYWAGYYSGLHDGQRQQQVQTQTQHEGGQGG